MDRRDPGSGWWWNALIVGGVSPGCSLLVSCGCDVVCSCLGKGPAARPCTGVALDPAVSQLKCDCFVPCENARCGSSRLGSSGYAARWLWSGHLCGSHVAFFDLADSKKEKKNRWLLKTAFVINHGCTGTVIPVDIYSWPWRKFIPRTIFEFYCLR